MSNKLPCILAIDQGTTSSRAIVFALDGSVVAQAQREFEQIYPRPGWVEHDPEALWASVLSTAGGALAEARKLGREVVAVGVTNQRETTIVWERDSGRAVYNAIVWQDRRTADRCRALAQGGHEPRVAASTGLLLDPYFSATKIGWILDRVQDGHARAQRGELCFGTVDSFLVWRLTGGQKHITDATNASRTSLYALEQGGWDAGLLDLFGVPENILPAVVDCAGALAETSSEVLGVTLPLTGMAGDQQAATVGQACFETGAAKCTFGTGAFLLVNTGERLVHSANRLLGTIAYRLDGRNTYALEGSVLMAGASVQWLRDALGIIAQASEVEALCESIDDTGGVFLVPAFAGLGAPHWDADARGALVGLTRGSGRAEIARAAVEAVAHQTADLVDAIAADGVATERLKIDGGMTANEWFVQHLADVLDVTVQRPANAETTAWGAACLAGLGVGLFASLREVSATWSAAHTTVPSMGRQHRADLRAGWQRALRRVASD